MSHVSFLSDPSVIVGQINSWVNENIKYVSDQELYRKENYYARPEETLECLKGDCDDIAILKHHMLNEYGLTSYLCYGKIPAVPKSLSHMICWCEPFVLDNRHKSISSIKLDFIPVYFFDAASSWIAKGWSLGQSFDLSNNPLTKTSV